MALGDTDVTIDTSNVAESCRPVTETATRQVPVCVPYQVPVTVMTTQVRPVAHQVPVTRTVMVPSTVPAASGPSATPQGQARP